MTGLDYRGLNAPSVVGVVGVASAAWKADTFEADLTRLDSRSSARPDATQHQEKRMKIGEAIEIMWTGWRVRRRGWNGKNMWIAIQKPDPRSKMTEPYVYMLTAQGGFIPWLASQADLLADDWEEIA